MNGVIMKKHLKKVLFTSSLIAFFLLVGVKDSLADQPGQCFLRCTGGCTLACDFGPCTHGSNWLSCNGYTIYCNC